MYHCSVSTVFKSKSVIYQPLGIFKKFPEKPFRSNSKPVNTIKKLI